MILLIVPAQNFDEVANESGGGVVSSREAPVRTLVVVARVSTIADGGSDTHNSISSSSQLLINVLLTMYLIKEVKNAAFTDFEDVVPFVKQLDDELFYLQKADTLRETTFGYCDLKKLESEVLSLGDDPR
ncbi:hypothetical protein LguiA_016937 [Lonicera macranthoides]